MSCMLSGMESGEVICPYIVFIILDEGHIFLKNSLAFIAEFPGPFAGLSPATGHFCAEFLIRVIIANLIGGLVAFMLMTGWLQNFAYRSGIGWQPFFIAGLLSLAMALLSVGYQAIKAASTDPVNTLRHE